MPRPLPVRSPITGIMQWCVLAPMVNHSRVYSGTKTKKQSGAGSNLPGMKPASSNVLSGMNSNSATVGTKFGGLKLDSDLSEGSPEDFQEILARLHAELLSTLLSVSHTHSSAPSTPGGGSGITNSLTSDDVALIVATLIAFSQQRGQSEGGGGGGKGDEMETERGTEDVGEGKREGGKGGRGMEESVERFAQFLQISLSAKALKLKPGNYVNWNFCISDISGLQQFPNQTQLLTGQQLCQWIEPPNRGHLGLNPITIWSLK